MKKLVTLLILMLIMSVTLNVMWWCDQPQQPPAEVTHDTLWRDTTIITPPAPAETVTTQRMVFVKVPVPKTEHHTDTLHDSITIELPVTQHRYDDSLYTAWVSGYQPALDSIRIRQRTILTTITRQQPAPRLTFGIQAAAGYGITTHRPDIFIGIGAQWRLTPR